MLKLYYSSTSPFARKVRIALEEKKIEYELCETSAWDDASPVHAANPLGKALGSNPIELAASQRVNTSVTSLGQQVQQDSTAAVASYKKVASLEPQNATAQFQLAQAAQQTGDTTTAVAAYKAYLKLSPGGSTATQVRALIKSLTKK